MDTPGYDKTKEACLWIADNLLQKLDEDGIITETDLKNTFSRASKVHDIPKVLRIPEVLENLPKALQKELSPYLRLKPVRTASGVSVVALMCKPHRCPHTASTASACIYCPGGPDAELQFDKTEKDIDEKLEQASKYSAQSYTGREPTSLRAVQARYHPYLQVRGRLEELAKLGHPIDKVEIVVMGGTFLYLDQEYRDWFVTQIHDALSGHTSSNIEESTIYGEHAKNRCVALCIETRPDYCLPPHIEDMLKYATTRLEIGQQTTYDSVMHDTNRGHTLRSVHRCYHQLKEAGFKVTAHMMPNLPKVSLLRDYFGFKEMFENPRFRTDGLKLYPTLVIQGTELYQRWQNGEHQVYPAEVLLGLISEMFAMCPPWTRVYRVQRDIPAYFITAGAEQGSNLRECALSALRERGVKRIMEVRAREVGITQIHTGVLPKNIELVRRDYYANGSTEHFLSIEDTDQNILLGLLRLRKMNHGNAGFRPEFVGQETTCIRELHVYGSVANVNAHFKPQKLVTRENDNDGLAFEKWDQTDKNTRIQDNETMIASQHQGIGSLLVSEAIRIAKYEHYSEKLSVIAGLGTRHYYRKLGFEIDGRYMSLSLSNPDISDSGKHFENWARDTYDLVNEDF